MPRYGWEYGGARRAGAGYDMEFGNWGDRSGLRGYDAHYRYVPGGDYGVSNYRGWNRGGDRGGWGMEGMYRHVRYGEEYDVNTPTPYHSGRDVRGILDRGERGRGGGYDRGRTRYTGMESNRARGVYGSDFRVGYDRDFSGHGGYRGTGWNRGGGMNPGRGERFW